MNIYLYSGEKMVWLINSKLSRCISDSACSGAGERKSRSALEDSFLWHVKFNALNAFGDAFTKYTKESRNKHIWANQDDFQILLSLSQALQNIVFDKELNDSIITKSNDPKTYHFTNDEVVQQLAIDVLEESKSLVISFIDDIFSTWHRCKKEESLFVAMIDRELQVAPITTVSRLKRELSLRITKVRKEIIIWKTAHEYKTPDLILEWRNEYKIRILEQKITMHNQSIQNSISNINSTPRPSGKEKQWISEFLPKLKLDGYYS